MLPVGTSITNACTTWCHIQLCACLTCACQRACGLPAAGVGHPTQHNERTRLKRNGCCLQGLGLTLADGARSGPVSEAVGARASAAMRQPCKREQAAKRAARCPFACHHHSAGKSLHRVCAAPATVQLRLPCSSSVLCPLCWPC